MSGIILVFLLLFVLQAATGYWWWVFVVPFLCGAFRSRTSIACVRSSSLGAGLLWMIGAVFSLLTDGGRVASQVASMSGIENPLLAVLLTTVVAAVAGGVAGLAGFQLKGLIGPKIRLHDVRITHPLRRSTRSDDGPRTHAENQEDRTTPVPGRAGRPTLE